MTAYLISLVAICGLLVVNGPEMRVSAEAEEARLVEQENRAFCSKLGIGHETARYAQCASELTQIRARHLQRHIGDSIL